VLWTSIACCLLYATVLDLGNVSIGYLKCQGISTVWLGGGKAIAVIVSESGIWLNSCLHGHMQWTWEVSGMIMIWLGWLCLCPSAISFFAENILQGNSLSSDTNNSKIILACMALARSGMFGFEQITTIVIHNKVDPNLRIKVHGVHKYLSLFGSACMCIFAMLYSDVQEFWILVSVSLCISLVSCMLHTGWTLCVYAPDVDKEKSQEKNNNHKSQQTYVLMTSGLNVEEKKKEQRI